MKLGVMQGVLPGQSDAERFRLAAELGFRGIEPDLHVADLHDSAAARLAELKAAKAATGLEVPSLCLGAHNSEGFIAQPGRSEAACAEIATAVRWCAELGARVLLVPFFGWNEPRNAIQRKRIVELFAPLCRDAEKLGVCITLEGTQSAKQLQEMAAGIGSAAFGVYFDLANVVWVDLDGPAEIRALGSLIKQVHFKETKVGPGDARPGQGRVNYAESAKALQAIGYNRWLVLETPTGPNDAIRADAAYARKFFACE